MGTLAGLLAGVYGWLRHSAVEVSLVLGVTTGLAVLLTVLFGSYLAHVALNASDEGRTPSSTMLSVTTMVFGTAVYVGLAFAAGPIAAAMVGR
jgi:hypothetical protein